MPDSAVHQTYLLSLWRETPGAPWRAALRLAGSGERIGFADLEALALFLLRLDEEGKRAIVEMDHAIRSHASEPASQEDKDIPDDAMTG